jgi:hypothetical protein
MRSFIDHSEVCFRLNDHSSGELAMNSCAQYLTEQLAANLLRVAAGVK